jgi:lipopolysaccharide export system permease protein
VGIITAKFAELREIKEGLFIVFFDGIRTQGIAGELEYAFETFSEYAMRIEDAVGEPRISIHGISTAELLKSDQLNKISELFRRLFVPMGILLLTLMAVPLAQVSPRGGVYGNLLTAFLIYFSFSNFQQVSLSWMVKGEIPIWLGFSGIYLLSLLVVIFLLVRLYGVDWAVISLTRKKV